jgi:periplasmic protein TonB
MFDMITGEARHIPNHNAVPLLISSIAEAAAIAFVVALPLLFLSQQVPEVPSIMAFVAAAPPPPPPPPPPAPRAAGARAQASATSAAAIPIEAPSEIRPEPPGLPVDEGVAGGIEGGIPGGVVGGFLGGIVEAPPPPPPLPQAPTRPVRIAGELKQPALLKRVEPEYPRLAVAANITGVVILEATVDERGDVTDVRVLRSVHALIDTEAIKAVRQWRYSPLTLNGHLSPFILTVTLSFSLTNAAG